MVELHRQDWCFALVYSWYVVPSSNSLITPAVWLQIYELQQWASFDEFIIWLKSCWLVSPLNSCTCPNGLKYYICKHSISLSMMLNQYEVNDKTLLQLLGRRRAKGRSKGNIKAGVPR